MRHHVESFLPVGLSDVDYTGAFHDQVGSSTVPEPLRTRLGFVFWPGSPSVALCWRAVSGISYDSWHLALDHLGTLQTFVIILCRAVGA